MSALKTVVITSNTSWYLYNFRKNTIIALLKEGYQVIAVSPKDDYSQQLADLVAEYQHVEIDQGGTNPIKDVGTLIGFIGLYRKLRPDVVLNFTPKNNIYSTLAASLFGAKSVNNIAGLGMVFINENITAKLARFLYKISQPKAHTIFLSLIHI